MKKLTKEMAATMAKAERANLALTEKLNKAHQDLGNMKTDLKRKADN